MELLKAGTGEAALLDRLAAGPVSLVLVPWYRYLAWRKLDALFGVNRTSGPAVAGYFADQLLPYELGVETVHLRCILLDFCNLKAHESLLLIRALLDEQSRAGIRPLLRASTPIYTEDWASAAGLGFRCDILLGLPEIARHNWRSRGASIRICLSALWSLIYEEGPGKSELARGAESRAARAHFQVGADEFCLAMRLTYTHRGWGPRDALEQFWPDASRPTAASQLLFRHADFVRVHTCPDQPTVEVTIGLLPSAPSERAVTELHTTWIEPLSEALLTDQAAGLDDGLIRPLPRVPVPSTSAQNLEAALKHKERLLREANQRVRQLRQQLNVRDELILELRRGGVGQGRKPVFQDADTLLEMFRQRFIEAHQEIEELERFIAEGQAGGTDPVQLEDMRKRIAAVSAREHHWLQQIASILSLFREGQKAG